MEQTIIPKEYNQKIIEHIFENALGSPIIFTDTPTASQMKANTMGKVKDATDYIYIKLADGKCIKIAATEVT